jgi:hypothetical protein
MGRLQGVFSAPVVSGLYPGSGAALKAERHKKSPGL